MATAPAADSRMPHIHIEEELRVWEQSRDAIQPTQVEVRSIESVAKLRIDVERWLWWKRIGDEGAHTLAARRRGRDVVSGQAALHVSYSSLARNGVI